MADEITLKIIYILHYTLQMISERNVHECDVKVV